MAYTPRYCTGTIDGYPDVPIQLQVNPTGDDLAALTNNGFTPEVIALGDVLLAAQGEEAQSAANAAFQEALNRALAAKSVLIMRTFGGQRYELGEFVLDFTSPEAALATVTDESLPVDIRAWLQAAPQAAVEFEQERIRANLKKTLRIGT